MDIREAPKMVCVDGLRFFLDKHRGYYLGYSNGKKIRLHRYIWEKHNGAIPKGYHIHHIDGNRLNNDISNLAMLIASEHESYHNNNLTDAQKAVRHESLEKARLKAPEWHCSEDGIEWHKEHGKKVASHLKDVKIKKTCKMCGNEFYDNGFNKALFCSNVCKSKWRRKEGLDNETRKCVICGKEFVTNKYSKVRTCSESCGSILGHRTREGKIGKEIGGERDSVQHDSRQESQLFDW